MWVDRLDSIVNAISFTFCFLVPACLTAKLISNFTLSRSYKGNDITLLNLQYFINYWLWYVILEQIQHLENFRKWSSGFYGVIILKPGIVAFTLWLFYYQGCMYINYCYLKLLAVNLFRRELAGFQDIDVYIINPIVSLVFRPRNSLLPMILKVWVTLFNQYDHHSIPNRILKFIHTIPRGTTVMDHALDTLFYVDDFIKLQEEYNALVHGFWGAIPDQRRHQPRLYSGRRRPPIENREVINKNNNTPTRHNNNNNQNSQVPRSDPLAQESQPQRIVSFDEVILSTPISDILNSDKEDVIEADEIPLNLSDPPNVVEQIDKVLAPAKTYAGTSGRNIDGLSIERSNTWGGNKIRSQVQGEPSDRAKSPIPSRSISPSINIIPPRGRSPRPQLQKQQLQNLEAAVKEVISGTFPHTAHRRSSLLQPPTVLRPTNEQSLPEQSNLVQPGRLGPGTFSPPNGRVRHLLDSHPGIPVLIAALRSNATHTTSPPPGNASQYRVNPSSLGKLFPRGSSSFKVNSTNIGKSSSMDHNHSSGSAIMDDYSHSDTELPYPSHEYLR